MMEHAQAFRHNRARLVRVRDGAERRPRRDRKEQQPAEPDDERQPDKSTQHAFHAHTEYSDSLFPFRWPGARPLRFANPPSHGRLAAMSKRLSVFVLATATYFFATAAAQTLLVADQTDHTVSLIDPAQGREVAAIAEHVPGQWGHEIAATTDGRTAFLPIYGNSGVGKPGIDGDKMLVIDLASRKITGAVNFGHSVRPHLPVLDPAHNLLYVTTELDQAITVIDPHTLKIVGKVPTGQKESHMLAISHDGRLGYTANVGPGTVSVLDLTGRKTVAVIPVARKVQRIAISRDDKWVFTSDVVEPRLAVIETATNKLKTWVPLPANGYGAAATRDGRWLLVAIPIANEVAVVDLQSMKVVREVPVAASPQEVLIQPDGRIAWVSCMGAGQVAAIDLTQWKVAKLIDAGKGDDGLAWAQ
jgi:DNA-binding beta-propeller fold protein YncE